jgi:hypothetical protein
MVQTIAEAYLDEGRTEGRVEEARNAVRLVLEAKFGPLPEPLSLAIAATHDVDRLRAALHHAALVTSLADFQL